MNQTTLIAPAAERRSVAPAPDRPPPARTWTTRLWRGKPDDSPLVRPALLALLLATGLLYLWGLGASGWANSFYSAAVQAGSASWKAFFFGSSDASNSITVDKTPMSLWPMSLSVRIFGLSSWSMLVPQALMGVGSVGLLYATVRRTTRNAWAGLLAGAILALTPVAVLMFRFNNPDALLTLFLIAAVYATIRAIESPERAVRWLVLGGTLVGFAFLTKMLQAFLVLPPLAAVYLIAAKPSIGKRLSHLLVAFGSMIAAAGWWIAIVELWPASSRPYIGGSQNNSILELTLGYNGFGRLNGDEVGSVGGGGGNNTGGGMWGSTGLFRLFTSEIGGQIAWLLPAALASLALGVWFCRKSGRTDRQLTGLIVWGGWLLVTGLTFSFMAGIFHAYYTVALAPAIAALVAIGASILWEHRESLLAALGAAFVARDDRLDELRPAQPGRQLRPVAQVRRRGRRCRRRLPDRGPPLPPPPRYVRGRPARPSSRCSPAPRRTHSTPRRPRTPARSRAPARARVAAWAAACVAAPAAVVAARWVSRRRRTAPARHPAAPRHHGWQHRNQGRHRHHGWRRGRRTAQRLDVDQRDQRAADDRCQHVHLGRRGDRLQHRLGLPARDRAAGHGDRRVQRLRSQPHAGAVQDSTSPTARSTTSSAAETAAAAGMNAGGSTSSEISTWVSDNFTAKTVDGVTIYDLSAGIQ